MCEYATFQRGGWFLNIATLPTSAHSVLGETKEFWEPNLPLIHPT
jgi:hypothetical protein